MVSDLWREGGIRGWGSFVFNEKLKGLKGALKEWNLHQFGNIDQKINEARKDLSDFDLKDETVGLTVDEATRRSECQANLIRLLCNKKSLLSQKSKLKWLSEGDTNSKVFHGAINRRSRNALPGLEIGGCWNEEPTIVKRAARDFFSQQFKRR